MKVSERAGVSGSDAQLQTSKACPGCGLLTEHDVPWHIDGRCRHCGLRTDLAFFVREDRDPLYRAIDGLECVVLFADAMRTVERYGLSLLFSESKLEYTCSDPLGLYIGRANTAAGAVSMWESKKEIDQETSCPHDVKYRSDLRRVQPQASETKNMTSMTHHLKCHPPYFEKIVSGTKKFEIRKNDRDFEVGDVLVLQEYEPIIYCECYPGEYRGNRCTICGRYAKGWKPISGNTDFYTGREFTVVVTYITNFPDGLRDGYVCMSIEPCTIIVRTHA